MHTLLPCAGTQPGQNPKIDMGNSAPLTGDLGLNGAHHFFIRGKLEFLEPK